MKSWAAYRPLRSIRIRTLIWNVVALLMTGALILAAVRQGVRFTLIFDLDEVLREDLAEIELYLEDASEPSWSDLQQELNRKALGHNYHGWFVQFYDAGGKPTWSSVGAPRLAEQLESSHDDRPRTVENLRVRSRSLTRRFNQAAFVTAGCRVDFVDRDMAQIDRLVAVVGAVILFASPVVGWLLMRGLIHPLAEMTHVTANIHPGSLDKRVALRGTGDELDSLAQTINGLLDRIVDYLNQERDFLANAAHELRTPLAAIQSSVEVALGSDRNEEEYRELLAIIVDQCGTLQTLVNQLLLMAESEADRLRSDAEPVDLAVLTTQAVDMFQGVAESQGLRLQLGRVDSAQVAGNRHHLRQVLNNLLDNAIKFSHSVPESADSNNNPAHIQDTPAAADILVELVVDADSPFARMSVSDHGAGISEEHLPRVFERFFRADQSRQRTSGRTGTGLGLSICKAIIEAHRGSIVVEFNPPQGTTFIVYLPLLAAATRHLMSARGGVISAAQKSGPSPKTGLKEKGRS